MINLLWVYLATGEGYTSKKGSFGFSVICVKHVSDSYVWRNLLRGVIARFQFAEYSVFVLYVEVNLSPSYRCFPFPKKG